MKPYYGRRPTLDELVEAHVLHAERTGQVYTKAEREKMRREADEPKPNEGKDN